MKEKNTRPSIAELEKLLDKEDETEIEILPNGEVRQKKRRGKKAVKVLTMRENLGGEYAHVWSRPQC